MMLNESELDRAARAIDALIAVLTPTASEQRTRADLFEALRTAGEKAPHHERQAAWERVRYLTGYTAGVSTPLYALMDDPEHREDPYTTGKVPSFGKLIACFQFCAGAYA